MLKRLRRRSKRQDSTDGKTSSRKDSTAAPGGAERSPRLDKSNGSDVKNDRSTDEQDELTNNCNNDNDNGGYDNDKVDLFQTVSSTQIITVTPADSPPTSCQQDCSRLQDGIGGEDATTRRDLAGRTVKSSKRSKSHMKPVSAPPLPSHQPDLDGLFCTQRSSSGSLLQPAAEAVDAHDTRQTSSADSSGRKPVRERVTRAINLTGAQVQKLHRQLTRNKVGGTHDSPLYPRQPSLPAGTESTKSESDVTEDNNAREVEVSEVFEFVDYTSD